MKEKTWDSERRRYGFLFELGGVSQEGLPMTRLCDIQSIQIRLK